MWFCSGCTGPSGCYSTFSVGDTDSGCRMSTDTPGQPYVLMGNATPYHSPGEYISMWFFTFMMMVGSVLLFLWYLSWRPQSRCWHAMETAQGVCLAARARRDQARELAARQQAYVAKHQAAATELPPYPGGGSQAFWGAVDALRAARTEASVTSAAHAVRQAAQSNGGGSSVPLWREDVEEAAAESMQEAASAWTEAARRQYDEALRRYPQRRLVSPKSGAGTEPLAV